MMFRPLRIALFFGIAWALFASEARAERSRRVVVHRNTTSESATLDASLRELLSRLGTTLEIASDGSRALDEGAFAVVDVSLSENDRAAYIVIRDRNGKEVSRRTISAEPGLRVEATAHVVQFAVEDLLTFEAATKPPPTPPPPPPAPPASTPAPAPKPSPPPSELPRAKWGADLGALFGVRSFGGGTGSVVGGGAEIGGTYGRGNWRPGVALSAQVHAPLHARAPLLEMSAEVLSFRIVPNVQLVGGRIWAIEGGVGGGVDVWITDTTSNDLPASSLASTTRTTPIATASVKGRLAVAKSADVVLAALIDGDLAPSRYVVNDQGARQAFFNPNRVRPALFLGFSFTLLGPDPYPSRGSE